MRRSILSGTAWLTLALLAQAPSHALHADARSEFMEASAHQQAKEWAEAAQSYTRVTALAPTYAPAWKQLASCRYYLGDVEGAEASAAHYLSLQPSDSSFAAWDAQLRQKLKLPPLPSTAPAAPAAAVAAPASDSLLISAPAPGADAEAVASAAASGPNSAAEPQATAPAAAPAEQSVGTEPAPAQAAPQAEAAPENTVSFGSEPSPSGVRHRPKPQVGLRLLGAFSLGEGSFSYGEAVNSSSVANDQGYAGKPGLGYGGAGELLLTLSPTWELSLGLYPIDWQETQQSSQTDTVTRSNESTASALFLPVMVGVGWRSPFGDGLSGLLSLGVGAIPSASVSVQSQTVQTNASGLTSDTYNATYNYGLALAWRVAAGLEFSLNKVAGVYIGAQVLGANFAAAPGTASGQEVDETGQVLGSANNLVAPGQSLALLSASALAGLSLHF